MSRSLLVLACSQRKLATPGLLPALQRYDGVNFRVLRKALREREELPPLLDILIVSARYGLIASTTELPYYDQRMTAAQARLLARGAGRAFLRLAHPPYVETFLNMGAAYRVLAARLPLQPPVIEAQGSIGLKMAQMKTWLHHIE